MTKLNATGSALVYSTYLGGSGQDYATGIAVDGSGDAYVTGNTSSTNFPTTPGSLQPVSRGPPGLRDRVESHRVGAGLLDFPRRHGGTFANGIAVDGSGNAYVTGVSFSNFPTTPGAFLTGSAGGAFVAKLNATGSALVYAAQLSGSGSLTRAIGSRWTVPAMPM